MPQQINLCTAAFRPVRKQFAARNLALALVSLLVLGGLLAGVWVWSLERSSASYRQTTASQVAEIASLQSAIAQSRAHAAPVDAALVSQLQAQRGAVAQREALVEAVKHGMFRPGEGHSDRMLMLSRSIPASVWITSMVVDQGRLEVAGFTLETAALNEWVKRLAVYPLMRDLQLTAVTVDNKTEANTGAAVATGRAVRSAGLQRSSSGSAPAVWSFSLVSQEPAAPASGAGAKP